MRAEREGTKAADRSRSRTRVREREGTKAADRSRSRTRVWERERSSSGVG